MNKTTVYLPDDLKAALSRTAASTRRSEAQLIREAIAALTAGAPRPRPTGRLFGGGDPGLSQSVDDALSGFGDR